MVFLADLFPIFQLNFKQMDSLVVQQVLVDAVGVDLSRGAALDWIVPRASLQVLLQAQQQQQQQLRWSPQLKSFVCR